MTAACQGSNLVTGAKEIIHFYINVKMYFGACTINVHILFTKIGGHPPGTTFERRLFVSLFVLFVLLEVRGALRPSF